ncbi:MAG: HAD-IA family hydrolase [Burkholderiaceae bacterium]|nr:HAD-IA family hydrolase [Burkholderiaceae bacterium]
MPSALDLFLSKPRQFDLIVFDWDGTLFDSTALITRCIQSACADVGAAVPGDVDASYVIGLGLVDALRHIAPDLSRERQIEVAARYRHHYIARQHESVFFEGSLAMLYVLKARNHRLAVATGKSRRGLDEALRMANLDGVFDATRTADETSSKPHPQMLLELMTQLDAPPGRTLMIGDTTHDMLLAANAGTARLAVSYGAHGVALLSEHAPCHVARTVADLQSWLLQNG